MLPSIKNYTFLELIAEGKHTMILRAKRKEDNLEVVIKVLKSQDSFPKDIERLKHEYELLKKIDSPRVVKAIELVPVQNSAVLVLENVPGNPLSELLDENWPLLTYLNISIEIAEALGEIHHRNIIHKDIKPQNILIDSEHKKIKIIDFGIASFFSREIPKNISSEQLEGSINYISPEQTGRLNRTLDYRTDLYSLGVTLYQLFTKKLPFEADSPLELIHYHIAQVPLSPKEVNPQIPDVLSDIIMKCLAKEPEHRYQSAFGLRRDLEKCRKLLLMEKPISSFEPGKEDVFDHFHLPEKLYGREKELNFLYQNIQESLGRSSFLVAISGMTGMGKTRLLQETQKKLSNRTTRVITFKLDPFKQLIPYHGLIKGLRALSHQLLTEPDEVINAWKERFREAIGGNGQILIDLIPELKMVMGEQIPLLKLPPEENENRFNYTLALFFKTLPTLENPLIFLIDDFQLADEPFLKLVEYLLGDASLKNIFFIVTFQDKPLPTSPTLKDTFKKMEMNGKRILHLPLMPLSIQNIYELLSDGFYGPHHQTEELATVLYSKTHGNPLFTLQLIKHLTETNLLVFDKDLCIWKAEIEAIKKVPVTTNVADLMIGKLKSLPTDVLRLIQICACLDSNFNAEILAKILKKPIDEILYLLNQAMLNDLIVLEKEDTQEFYPSPLTFYGFLHDRVRESAYSMITEKEKENLHHQIGRVLLELIHPSKREEMSSQILHHFNLVSIQNLEQEERELLSQLNLWNGVNAKDAVAYASAINYFSKGIKLLPENSWKKNYFQAMSLYQNLALCLMITGKSKGAENLFDLCLKRAKTALEKAEIYAEIILLNTQMREYTQAFENARKAMQLFKIPYSPNPTIFSLAKDLLTLKLKMFFRKVEDLESLPIALDENVSVICKILGVLIYPAFITGRKYLFLRNAVAMINLSLKHGLTKHTSVALSAYAMALGSEMFKDYEASSKYGLAALNIAKRFPKTVETAGVIYAYNAFISRWKHPLQAGAKALRENFRLLLETGAGSIAANNIVYYNLIELITGQNLNENLERMEESLKEIKKFSSVAEEISLSIHREVCRALKGLTIDPTDPLPIEFKNELNATQTVNQNLLFLLRYQVWRVILLYTFGKYEQAKALGMQVLKYKNNYPNWIEWHLFYFFHALSLAACLKEKNGHKNDWKLLLEHYKKLKRWGSASKENYLVYELLVGSEIESLKNNFRQALHGYEVALVEAKKANNIQQIALAYELLGKFYESQHLKELAAIFFPMALQYYSIWGAAAKCADLKLKFGEYLTFETQTFVSQALGGLSNLIPITLEKKSGISASKSTLKTDSSFTSVVDFDVQALVDASHALSREIVLDQLMHSLMRTVIVNAGADKAFLILFENQKPFIYSQIIQNQKYLPLITPIPAETHPDLLCISLLKYVARTKTECLLNNASEEGNFINDPYVLAKKAKSILAVPLLQKGELTGVLYLENTSIKGAFTPKRIRLLTLLSAQMATSIENAQFYAKLEKKVQDRTKEIQEKNTELQGALQTIQKVQQQMIQQEKLASLGLLTSGIAHELKNPLNFIMNFSELAQERLSDLKRNLSENNEKDTQGLISEIQECLLKVVSHGKRSDSIIKGMLAHAHQGSSHSEQIDLNALIDQALNLIYHSYRKKDARFNLKVEKKFSPSMETLEGFPGDLIRVFINIIDNACYALLEKMDTNLKNFTPTLFISTEQKGNQAIIVLRDNGAGLAPHILNKIFQPFYTTKPSGTGTGLGLSIAYDIITKQHGGIITVRSQENEYTEFSITLPISFNEHLKEAA